MARRVSYNTLSSKALWRLARMKTRYIRTAGSYTHGAGEGMTYPKKEIAAGFQPFQLSVRNFKVAS